MEQAQKTLIKKFVKDGPGKYLKLLQNKKSILEQPDGIHESFDRHGQSVSYPNYTKSETRKLLKFLQDTNITEADFVLETTYLENEVLLVEALIKSAHLTEEEIVVSIDTGNNSFNEKHLLDTKFITKEELLTKIQQRREDCTKLKERLASIKTILNSCETLAKQHGINFELCVGDIDLEYRTFGAEERGYWYTSSERC